MTADVSIAIVNFNTVDYIAPLLETIRAQEYTVDGRPGVTEVILIDNASKGEDSWGLSELVADDVKLVQNTQNTGYAQANNQGFHVATGTYHMVLNPDTRLLPGCLENLVGFLEAHPDVTMVGPKAYMDLDETMVMPPNELPTPELLSKQAEAQRDNAAAAENLERRTRFSWAYWSAEEPIEVEMLSGCCFLFRRSFLEGEHLFDPGYPLYYEDTDLFLRLKRRGEKMVFVPDAGMVHFFSRSAYTHAKGAEYRHDLSQDRYFEKHFGEEGTAACRDARASGLAVKAEGSHVRPMDFEEITAFDRPPEFYVDPAHTNYYVEMAGNPSFTLAAAIFPKEDGWFTLSDTMWEQIGPTKYWLRCVDRESLQTLQAWELEKEEDF